MLLDTIRQKLIDDGVVDGTTWKCFIGAAPDDQDQLISLQLTGGFEQDTLGGENVLETFQVRVRSGAREYVTCEAKWRAMFDSLHDADLSASNIYLIQALATGPLTWDDDKLRTNMSANFRVTRDKP